MAGRGIGYPLVRNDEWNFADTYSQYLTLKADGWQDPDILPAFIREISQQELTDTIDSIVMARIGTGGAGGGTSLTPDPNNAGLYLI